MRMTDTVFDWLKRRLGMMPGQGALADLAEPPFTESALPPDPDQREIARYVLRSTLYPPRR